jgi:hypothetical protein
VRALIIVAVGIGFVALDFRTDSLDLLADPVGWVLVAIGAHLLAVRRSVGLAAVAAVLSVTWAWLPFRYALIDPATGEVTEICRGTVPCNEDLRYDEVSDLRAVVMVLAVVVGAAALVLVLRSLRTSPGWPTVSPRLQAQMRLLEMVVPLFWAAPVVLAVGIAVVGGGGFDPVWNGSLAFLGATRTAVLLWMGVLLLVIANADPGRPRRQRYDLTPDPEADV